MKRGYILVGLLIILVLFLLLTPSTHENYPGRLPNACIDMLDRGFSDLATHECQQYSQRCDQQINDATPSVAAEVTKLYDVPDGMVSNDVFIKAFKTDPCATPLRCSNQGECPGFLRCGADGACE